MVKWLKHRYNSYHNFCEYKQKSYDVSTHVGIYRRRFKQIIPYIDGRRYLIHVFVHIRIFFLNFKLSTIHNKNLLVTV